MPAAESMPEGAILILMDVDGVLNPALRTAPDGTATATVAPVQAQALSSLTAAENTILMWATTHPTATTDAIAAQAGIQEAGRIPLRGTRSAAEKLEAVRRWAERATADPADRPAGIVIVDDSLTGEDTRWAATQPVPVLLIRPDPARGLTAAHVEAIRELGQPPRHGTQPAPEGCAIAQEP